MTDTTHDRLVAAIRKRQEVCDHYATCENCDDDGSICEDASRLELQEIDLRRDAVAAIAVSR